MKEQKNLIYPTSFKTYGGGVERGEFFDPMSGIAPDRSFNGILRGINVKTKEEIEQRTNHYISDFSLSDGSDRYFSENDVLFINFRPFSGYSIDEDKPSFEEVSEFYESLKNEGITEEEINDIVIKHFEPNTKTR